MERREEAKGKVAAAVFKEPGLLVVVYGVNGALSLGDRGFPRRLGAFFVARFTRYLSRFGRTHDSPVCRSREAVS